MRGPARRSARPGERRQSWRLTRREVTHLMSRRGRKWVSEVWQAAARTSAELDGLSPLTTPLGNRLVESYAAAEGLEGGDIQRALRIATVAGYASRMVLAEPTEQPTLKRSAFQLGPRSDARRLAEDAGAVEQLLEPVRRVASQGFDSAMALPQEVWTAYVATATMKLQRQLASSSLSWRDLGRERIETMLRYGYVLRCLDEALDAEPALRAS
jgi:hypothetical protein